MFSDAQFIRYFFFNDTATTEIYTLSLHDALPISGARRWPHDRRPGSDGGLPEHRHYHDLERRLASDHQPQQGPPGLPGDRKSTRLNSSHANISYAVFCLKKKKMNNKEKEQTSQT